MNWDALLKLTIVFGSLSLMAVGGTNTIIPEMHQEVVDEQHWMSDSQFGDVFGIAQAAPGPSTLIVTLIGMKVDGLAGALVATFAMTILPLLLTYLLTHYWEKARDMKWRKAVEHGLAPITVGLVFASALVVARAADHNSQSPERSAVAYTITIVTALIFAYTKIHPLAVIGICGVIGYFGLV